MSASSPPSSTRTPPGSPDGSTASSEARSPATCRPGIPSPTTRPPTSSSPEVRVLTHHDHAGRVVGIDHGDAVAIHVPAWRQVFVVPLHGEHVLIYDVSADGTLTLVAAYRGGRVVAHRPAPTPANPPSDEVVRHMVDAQLEELAGHLTAPIAVELREAVATGDVAWTPGMAEQTCAGRLAVLTLARRRAYGLEHDQAGRSLARVTTLDADGTASSATFRDGELLAGQISRIV